MSRGVMATKWGAVLADTGTGDDAGLGNGG